MILGDRVRLRAIEREDIPTFVRWFNDPEVRQYLTMYGPMSRAAEEQWFERQLEAKDRYLYAIETLEGVHIGNISLDSVDWRNRQGTLGIVIGEKSYWGLGYGSDAILTLLDFAFDTLNLHCVSLHVFDFNERAKRAYVKCGFIEEGRLRERLFHDGTYHDILVMSVLREGHRASRERHQAAKAADVEQ